jgi:hypothetical protein
VSYRNFTAILLHFTVSIIITTSVMSTCILQAHYITAALGLLWLAGQGASPTNHALFLYLS